MITLTMLFFCTDTCTYKVNDSIDSPQTGAPTVTQWTDIVTLVPYSTAISGAKSIGTQLT